MPPRVVEQAPPQMPAPRPPPQTAAPTAAPPPRISASWEQALAAWIAAHKVYPEEANRRGEQGNVTVRFTVEPSGHVANVQVVHGSGSSRLDAAAEALFRNATLPPFGPAMPQVPITTAVQIRYVLED